MAGALAATPVRARQVYGPRLSDNAVNQTPGKRRCCYAIETAATLAIGGKSDRSTIDTDMISLTERCEHVSEVRQVTPRTSGCEECLALGVPWNELRVCLSCGHVGCCEDSAHAHALQHFNATGHPLIASLERGETWGWCYIHRRYFGLAPESLPKRRSAHRTLKIVAAIAASFAGLAGTIILLSVMKIITFGVAKLMLVALLGMYVGFGILIAIYRLIRKLE